MIMRFVGLTILCSLLAACGSPATTTPASGATYTTPATVQPAQSQAPSATGLTAADLRPALQTLSTTATTAIVAAGTTGNKTQAKQATDAFEATWVTIEEGVKERSPDGYKAIEQAMSDLQDVAVRADNVDATAIQAKGAALTKALTDFNATLK